MVLWRFSIGLVKLPHTGESLEISKTCSGEAGEYLSPLLRWVLGPADGLQCGSVHLGGLVLQQLCVLFIYELPMRLTQVCLCVLAGGEAALSNSKLHVVLCRLTVEAYNSDVRQGSTE